MTQYRKKPVVIEAVQIERKFCRPEWLVDALEAGTVWWSGGEESAYYTIKTLEGEMRASEGDWIIRGIQGELYPCKPDIFEATYEAV